MNPFSIFQVFFILLFSLVISTNVQSQNAFSGKIVYKVEMLDTAVQQLIDARDMVLFTNDTLSRVELMNDALGEQVTIKHLSLKKSYILMTMVGKKLAIQTTSADDTVKTEPYVFKYHLFGKKKINGHILKKVTVYREDLGQKKVCWYFKDIRPDLMEMYPGIIGLPADFYVGTVDGIVHYSLQSIENKAVEKDLFGIPSDYEKISLLDFLNHVRGIQN